MSILYHLFLFRGKQFFRMLQSIGLGVLLIFIPIGFLGVLSVLQLLWKAPVPLGGLGVLAGLLSLHWKRGDRFFLEQLTPRLASIYGVEYWILSSPAAFFFVRWGQWWNLGLLAVGIGLLAFIRPPYESYQGKKGGLSLPANWIPLTLWEWRAGWRQQGWWMLPLYVAAFAGVHYTATTPVLALTLAITACSFYQYIAPLEIIQASNKDLRFLRRKVGQSVLFFQGLLLPHYLLFVAFQGTWQVAVGTVAIILITSAWISFSICLQYKSYHYDSEQVTNTLPLAIYIGAGLVPFFWPLLPFFLIYYWRLATKQLNLYA